METSILSEIEWKVLKLIGDKGISVSVKDIANYLGISKGYASKVISRLERKGLIERVSSRPASFRLTKLGESFLYLPGREARAFRVDGLRVRFSRVVFRGGWRDFLIREGRRNGGVRNWEQWFLRYLDCTVIVNFGREPSVEVLFDRFWVSRRNWFDGSLYGYVLGRVLKVVGWLSLNGIIVDVESMSITNHEFESFIKGPEADKIENTYRVSLGRKAKSLFGKDTKHDAHAWIDLSLGPPERGSDDAAYWEKYLLEPEYVYEIYRRFIPAMEKYTEQLTRHLEVLESMDLTLKEIRRSFERRPSLISRLKSLFRRVRDGENKS